ncbi:MAG: guanylate kinase [Candidatus Tokpelaia sp. JSC161]|nr:MAG: guanylate kinase [Candidatus Tokpelaia sp. JSC161]
MRLFQSIKKKIKKSPLIVVISSPSGTGKSTISRLLSEDHEMALILPVSVTTRQRRVSEVDGIDYHFITFKEFERLRETKELMEWAEVHGNYYATLRGSFEKLMDEGKDVLFDIDYQGAAQLKKRISQEIVSIFILPPSMNELISRLKNRAEDTQRSIDLRIERSRIEMLYWNRYNYVIINENLSHSLKKVKAIITAERLKCSRSPWLKGFIDNLINEHV